MTTSPDRAVRDFFLGLAVLMAIPLVSLCGVGVLVLGYGLSWTSLWLSLVFFLLIVGFFVFSYWIVRREG